MELLWITYKTKKKHKKVALFLSLGADAHKLHLLKTSELHPREITRVRAELTSLDDKPLAARITWLRDNVPNGFKKGYRTLFIKESSVLNKYKPKP